MISEEKTLSSKIHDRILEIVIETGVSSEELLLTEGELVERFGVSKAPVREALQRLCGEGVLKSIPRCGYVIVRLGEKHWRDNLYVRKLLELTSLRENFDRFTPEILREFDARLENNQRLCEQELTVWQIWRANREFHCDLISVSGNQELREHLLRCLDVEERFYAQNHFSPDRKFIPRYTPESHRNILLAIERHDLENALGRLEQDITGDMHI